MSERRRYQRYQMSQDVYCDVLVGNSSYKAQLYDLSSNGSRLKILDAIPQYFTPGVQLQMQNYSKGGEYLRDDLSGHAVWKDGQHYGIEYDMAIVDSMDALLSAFPEARAV